MKQWYFYSRLMFWTQGFFAKNQKASKILRGKIGFIFMLLAGLTSCPGLFSRDPLMGVSQDLREGVLQTGEENWNLFNPVLVDRLLKIKILGQENLLMSFQEGEEGAYSIQFRFLNGFENHYDIIVEDNDLENILKGSTWNYDPDKLTALLSWKPIPSFNSGELYKMFHVTIPIRLRKKSFPDKDKEFSISRTVQVLVHQKVFPSLIRKVLVGWSRFGVGQTWTQLEDKKFYRSDGISFLDLTYHDLIFMLRTDPHNTKARVPYQDFWTTKNPIIYPFDDLSDRDTKNIDSSLLPFIQQAYYIENKNSVCDFDFCLLEERSRVPIDTKLYVKVYEKPPEILANQIYYLLESPELCKRQYKNSASFMVFNLPKEPANYKEQCYILLESLRDTLKELRESDENRIYLLENKELKKADLSKWSSVYKKIPEFIKWGLSAYRPVKENVIPIAVQYNNTQALTLSFEIENKNGFSHDLQLVRDLKKLDWAYWSFPVNWRFMGSEVLSSEVTRLKWELIPQKDVQQSQQINLSVFSQTVRSDGVSIKLTLLPAVHSQEIHQLQEPAIVQQIFEPKGSQKQWLESSLILNNQIQKTYILPQEFYSQLIFYQPKSKIESVKKALYLGSVETLPKPKDCVTQESCKCSKEFSFYQKENDDNIYVESQCVYESQVQFKREYYQGPQYVQHRHSIETFGIEIGLKRWTAGQEPVLNSRGQQTNQVINPIKSVYRLRENLRQLLDPGSFFSGSVFHIFFDLKPAFWCSPAQESEKKCSISYEFQTQQKNLDVKQWNDKEKGLFSPQALELGCVFKENSLGEGLPCQCQTGQVLMTDSPQKTEPFMGGSFTNENKPSTIRLEFECLFPESNEDILIEWFLKTEHPNIFLLNTENRDFKQGLKSSFSLQGVK